MNIISFLYMAEFRLALLGALAGVVKRRLPRYRRHLQLFQAGQTRLASLPGIY
jgi:hypothetical protein